MSARSTGTASRSNFFVIGPPALLEDQPQTYITALYLPDDLEQEKNRWLREFPAVTAIDVAALLAQVRSVIDQATRAVEYVFLFTLFAGLTVLYAAVQATRDVRRRETALLRTLGARRQQIRNGLLAEFGTLGLLSGLLAALIASAVGGVLAWQVFGFDYTVNPMTFVFGIVGRHAGHRPGRLAGHAPGAGSGPAEGAARPRVTRPGLQSDRPRIFSRITRIY
jgi:putative ABC transport system permease protein